MAQAQAFSGYLAFDSLDVPRKLEAAYAVGYRLLDQPDDLWTGRFLQFKEGSPSATEAGNHVMSRMAKKFLSARGIRPNDVTFVPALTSSETSADSNGILSSAAKHIADALGAHYSSDLLSKRRHTSLHADNLNRAQRQQAVAEANFQARNVAGRCVVLIDDFITTGATLQAWASAIKSSNPECSVLAMSLAKNERLAFAPEASNDHLGSKLDAIWRRYSQ